MVWGQGSAKWVAAAWHVLSHAARAESTLRIGSVAKPSEAKLLMPRVARKLQQLLLLLLAKLLS